MKIGVMASGKLGFVCFKHMLNSENKIECVLTDSGSLEIVELAKETGVSFFKGNPRLGKASDFIASHKIDILISVNYLFLVDEDIIHWPKIVAINFHGSLLPLYRGRTPQVWAIINGEKKAGVTGHVLEKDCDAGDVLIQKEVEIGENTTGGDLLNEFNKLYPSMLDELLFNIKNNKLVAVKQDESKATFFGKRTPEDGQIDWNWGAIKIKNWVRAQAYPYPGAFTFLEGSKIIIDKVDFIEKSEDYDCAIGTIISNAPVVTIKINNGVVQLSSIRAHWQLITVGEVLGLNSEVFRFRKASLADEKLYYDWVTDPSVRKFSLNSNDITREEHHHWFKNSIANEEILMLIFHNDLNEIGQVRIQKKEEAIISVSIDSRERGKGYASKIIRTSIIEFCKINGLQKMVAYIKKENEASVAVFTKLGFELEEENTNGEVNKYILR